MTTEIQIAAKTASRIPERGVPENAPLSPDAIAALVKADHADPFSILGPHRTREGVWEIRAIVPGAETVEVVAPDGSAVVASMTLRHPAGFFVATVKSAERPWYRLRIKTPSASFERYDLYAFGPILDDDALGGIRDVGSDAHYTMLGAHPPGRRGRRRFSSPSGRRTPAGQPRRRLQRLGRARHPMRLRHGPGVWELFVPDLQPGMRYKFEIKGRRRRAAAARPIRSPSRRNGRRRRPPSLHGLPRARPGATRAWMDARARRDPRKAPMSIYECHLGSWARVPEEGNRYLTYRELAERLIPYVKDLGFTHIELLPITEYPVRRLLGLPARLALRADEPLRHAGGFRGLRRGRARGRASASSSTGCRATFPNDPHGLGAFDGTHLYEHADPRQGFHQDWGTYIYNYGRQEVAAFLVANARFWLEHYHLDGLRVDAVASMLYLDYSREPGEWVPNRYGGNENLEAIDFLRRMNETAYARLARRRHHRRGIRPPGPASRTRPIRAASASASSGTWAGCTTPCATSARIRSTAATTTTT